MVTPIVELLKAVGLPTLFCLWLMLRVEKRLDSQTEKLTSIAESMVGILEHVREDK